MRVKYCRITVAQLKSAVTEFIEYFDNIMAKRELVFLCPCGVQNAKSQRYLSNGINRESEQIEIINVLLPSMDAVD